MKRFLIATALLVTVFFSCLPVSAQKSNLSAERNGFGRIPVRYGSLAAFTDGRGVWLKWETELEKDTLGFFVYRIIGGEKQLVDKALIPGAPRQAVGTQRGSYSYYDRFGDVNSVYVIESYHNTGQRFDSNQIRAEFIDDLTKVAGVSSEELENQAIGARSSVTNEEANLPADLAAEVQSYRQAASATQQQWVAAQAGVKISVRKEGFYRVSRADLQSNGFDVNAPTARWQLYLNGVEQAIVVGENGSHIEFYGKGLETLESDNQVYFLVVGSQDGKRIASTTRRRIGGSNLSSGYSQSFYLKGTDFYTQNIFNGEEENIFGTSFDPGFAGTVDFDVSNVDFTAVNSSIEIKVQGFSLFPHQIRIFLNDVEIGTMQGNSHAVMMNNFNFQTATLREGSNTLRLTSSAGPTDINVFSSLNLKYPRKYRADQNRLSFYVPNYQASYVEGFTTSNVRVFDTTNPNAPVLLTNLPIEQVNGSHRVYLPSNRGRVLQAVENSSLLTPATLLQNNPSTLSTTSNAGDLIIISHRNFMTQAESWANYRRNQGLAVKVVDIEDVFDEFNFGVSKSLAIRSFLNYAKNSWQNAPEYALLIGDGTFDPKNYFNNNGNFIPSKLVDTVYSETSSDDTLADFNEDGLSEIAIGRIPFRTTALVEMMLNKTIAFENPATGGLERKVIFASDLPDGYDFEGFSNRLCDLLQNPSLCIKINRAQPNVNALLVGEMNSSRYMVNYAGHGNLSGWATSAFFGNSHASQLNHTKMTFYTLLTCLNGYYIGSTDSLTDTLLKNPSGGAVAAWASTGLTTPDIQEIMATRFYTKLREGTIPRAGDLIRDAKSTINFGIDVRLSWTLHGDPTLKLR